ncbi:hypothetical protein BJV82DRAFT_67640 [Fennellomyces sp. T-0311]|nr:hypothetical protein BJV82DRAFT_67640 [Fennellomyces sp. T-0311]
MNGRQGWLYISENYLGFYSFLLGVEKKQLVELKDIKDITKENSKRNMFADSLKIVTKEKEETHMFSNMFRRDEVYDLLVQLAGQAMLRVLRNAGGDAPGHSTSDPSNSPISERDRSIRSPESTSSGFVSPLKHDLAAQKRNMDLCLHFKLPLTEKLVMNEINVGYTSGSVPTSVLENNYYPGHLYLSESFLSFESINRQVPPQQHLPLCSLVLPLYTIKRVERLSSGSYATSLSITTWHKMEHVFHLHVHKTICEQFCGALGKQLSHHRVNMKKLRPFLETCESENMLNAEHNLVDVSTEPMGGLGVQFGYPGDARKAKDKSKMKLWRKYFQGNEVVRLANGGF